MKITALSAFLLALILQGCTIAGDPATGAEQIIQLLQEDDYEEIYDVASDEFRNVVPGDLYSGYTHFMRATCGRLEGARLFLEQELDVVGVGQTEFNYKAKFTAYDDSLDLKLVFIQDEMMSILVDPPYWKEPKSAGGITRNFFTNFNNRNYAAIFESLHPTTKENVSTDQIFQLLEKISGEAQPGTYKYYYCVMAPDRQYGTLIELQYVSEGAGILSLNYAVQDEQFILAGIYFNPEPNLRQPQ